MESIIPQGEFVIFHEIGLQGSRRAAEALGMFSGNTLTVNKVDVSVIPVEEIPFFQTNPEETIVGVDFSITGDLNGFLLAYFREHDARLLLNTLMGSEPDDVFTLGEMEQSAIGEAGNIIVASFLSCLETVCGLCVMPSPPLVAVEMCSAVLSSAVMPLAEEGGDVLIIKADIEPLPSETGTAASCQVLFLPTLSSWEILREAFWAHQPS